MLDRIVSRFFRLRSARWAAATGRHAEQYFATRFIDSNSAPHITQLRRMGINVMPTIAETMTRLYQGSGRVHTSSKRCATDRY